MTADLSALIARLEAAEVGSRELDAEICVLLQYGGPNSEGAVNVRTDSDWEGDLLFEHGDDECCNTIPPVTTSLDAALALAERVLKGWAWEIRLDESGASVQAAPVWWMEGLAAPDEGGVSCEAAAPALALVIAILRAKQGEGE